ncbi:hypothetical protein MBANPS3_002140 [Mucor bainieri]
MFSQVPTEIAVLILSHLPKDDLLECLTVSQSLYQLVLPILYRHVCSTDVSRISQGLQLLCSNPTIAQHVHHLELSIERGFEDVDKLRQIPRMCSNLHQLHLKIDHDLSSNIKFETACQHTLQHLSIKERGGSYIPELLQSAIFTSLTSLHVGFLQAFWLPGRVLQESPVTGKPAQAMIDLSRKIIPCLLNAPALTTLNISYAKFDLKDMEDLHSNLPNLRELTLINACFPITNTRSTASESIVIPLIKFKSFHLVLKSGFRRPTRRAEIEHSLQEWLTYIERKYTKLTAFKMEMMYGFGYEIGLLAAIRRDVYIAAKNQMQRLVFKLHHLQHIEAELFPFTKSNVDLCSNHNLQAVGLFDNDTKIEEQMKNLQNSKQKKSIRSVSMALFNPESYDDDTALQRLFAKYPWDQLTKLDIKSYSGATPFGSECKLSLYLLQYMPSLEVLKVCYIVVVEENIPGLPPNRLKSLDIFHFVLFSDHWRASNRYLQAILQASPLLETFSTKLEFETTYQQHPFVMDFTGNKQLRSVHLNYYSNEAWLLLEHDSKRTEKYWKTLTTSIKNPKHVEEYSLIDLRWNNETKVVVYAIPPSAGYV